MRKPIKVKKFIEELHLTPIYLGNQTSFPIESSDLNRPGLQLAGFFDYFDPNRIQIIGKVEST